MSATVDMSIVIAAIENFPISHKVAVLEALVKATKPSLKMETKKAPKEKKEKDPDAPKKEANWWIHGTQYVISRLQALNPENADEFKKPIVRTNIPKLLKEREYLVKDSMPSDEQITQAYKDWKEDPTIQARFAEARVEKKAKKAETKKEDVSDSEADVVKEVKEKKARKPRVSAKEKKNASSSDSSISQFVPSEKPVCEEGYGIIEGVKYRLSDGTLESGCFVYIGDECKGFYYDGAVDASITP